MKKKQHETDEQNGFLKWFLKLFERKPNYSELYSTFHLISVFYRVGISNVKSYLHVADRSENKMLKRALIFVAEEIKKGNSLSRSFELSKTFPNVCVALIRAGEESGGSLEKCYKFIEVYFKQQVDVLNKLQGVIRSFKQTAVLGVISLFVIVKFAFPQMVEIFRDRKATLPAISQFVYSVLQFLSDNTLFVVLFLALAWYGFRGFASRNPKIIDGWKMKLPFYKKLYHLQLQHRFCFNMGVMLHGGVPIFNAITYLADIMDNELYKEYLLKVASDIRKDGCSITEAFERGNNNLLSSTVLTFISVGEESGAKLPDVLLQLSETYREDIMYEIDNTVSNVEFLVLVVSIVLGVTVFGSLMIPNYTISTIPVK